MTFKETKELETLKQSQKLELEKIKFENEKAMEELKQKNKLDVLLVLVEIAKLAPSIQVKL